MTALRGRVAIEAEMSRQRTDAAASFWAARAMAQEIARSIRTTGRMVLLGMGGSHCLGRTVEPLYRALGVEATASTFSEQLDTPSPLDGATVIATSQSGESAEAVRWLSERKPSEHCFGITMEAGSTLGMALPCLVGSGGSEVAVAATRSLTIALAQHLAVLEAMGADPAAALSALQSELELDLGPTLEPLRRVSALVTSGRTLRGLAEGLALGVAELARIPSYPVEAGQMRHGPIEVLGPDVGVVLIRCQEANAERFDALATTVHRCGSPVVVFDASERGEGMDADAVIKLPPSADMPALFLMLPVLQRFMLEFGSERVVDVGEPKYISKVTVKE